MTTTANAAATEVTRDAEETTGGSKKNRVRVIALGVLSAAALGIVGWYVVHAGLEGTDDAQIDADVVSVPARVQGVALKVLFEDNQRVKAGDVLVEIDPAQTQAHLDEAVARLAADEAAATAADSEVNIIETTSTGQRGVAVASLRGSSLAATATADQITQADAQVKQSTVTRDQARTDFDRVKQLFAQGALPKQQLDDAQSRLDGAEAGLIQARAHQSFIKASQAEADSKVAEANARVQQSSAVGPQVEQARARAAAAHARAATSKAARDLAALDLVYTKIVAPHDGFASKKSVVVGQMIGLGQPVVQIVPVNEGWVTANFKETQINAIRVGQPVEIDVDAYTGLKLHGTVQSFSGATGARFSLLPPENATGNFTKVVQRVPVRIRLENFADDRPLRPGMSVEVTVDTRK